MLNTNDVTTDLREHIRQKIGEQWSSAIIKMLEPNELQEWIINRYNEWYMAAVDDAKL